MKTITSNLPKPILLINNILLIVIFLITSCNKTEETVYLETPDTLLIKELAYNQDNPDTIVTYTDYYYNSSRLLIKTKSYFNAYYNHEGIIPTNYDTIEYNTNNQIIKRTNYHFNRQTHIWEISGIETHTTPNDSTEIISNLNYATNYTNSYVLTRKNNLLIRNETFNNTYLYQTITYEYLNSKLYSEKIFFHSNELMSTNIYSYYGNTILIKTYDSEDKLIKCRTEKYDENRLLSVYEKDYKWGGAKEIIRIDYDTYGRKYKEYRNAIVYPFMSSIVTPKIIVYQYSVD